METNLDNLKQQFARIGARLEISHNQARRTRNSRWQRSHQEAPAWSWRNVLPFSANVRTDKKGEHFTVTLGDNSQVPDFTQHLKHISVLDSQPQDRHLLLQVVLGEGRDKQVDTLLMGHDERHWFIASAPGTTVQEAKEALRPPEVTSALKRKKVKRSKRNRRKNAAYTRQGEWFFLPAPEFQTRKFSVTLQNEPLQRGGGKPHMAEELCRTGGTTVMVSRTAPNGISMDEYNQLPREQQERPTGRRGGLWRAMTRDATVYVRGRIRHPDHKTLKLQGWHRVLANTEQVRAASGRLQTMAFLD